MRPTRDFDYQWQLASVSSQPSYPSPRLPILVAELHLSLQRRCSSVASPSLKLHFLLLILYLRDIFETLVSSHGLAFKGDQCDIKILRQLVLKTPLTSGLLDKDIAAFATMAHFCNRYFWAGDLPRMLSRLKT